EQAEQRQAKRLKERNEQEYPEERQADDEARQCARHQDHVVKRRMPRAAPSMPRKGDDQIGSHSQGAADDGEEQRVGDAALKGANAEKLFEIVQRQVVEKVYARSPAIDECADGDTADRKDDRDREPGPDAEPRDE